MRMLDSIRWHLANGSRFDALALGVAGWMRYVGGIDEQGQPIKISDPLKEMIAETVQHSVEGESRIAALLTLTAIFGEDLPKNPAFVALVTQHYLSLLAKGVKETLQKIVW